jgi:hypothetical protein
MDRPRLSKIAHTGKLMPVPIAPAKERTFPSERRKMYLLIVPTHAIGKPIDAFIRVGREFG